MARLRALGAEVEAQPDGMRIRGGAPLRGGVIESHHDHRIALSGAILGLAASGETTVNGYDAADVSFPGFAEQLSALGASVQVHPG